MEEADTRRQRPRVSESEAQGIAGYGRRIAALEARVQQISAQTDVVVAAPQTEAERLLSAVLADIARLSAHRVVDGAAPELEAERLLSAGQYADATEPLQRAIQSGHLPSRALLAWIFMFAREGIAKNQNTAIELVQEGTRLGCHHCQGVLAYCLWNCHTQFRNLDGVVDCELDPPPKLCRNGARELHTGQCIWAFRSRDLGG